MVVLDFIMDKIKEKPELVKPFPDGVDAKMPQDRDKQVRITASLVLDRESLIFTISGCSVPVGKRRLSSRCAH